MKGRYSKWHDRGGCWNLRLLVSQWAVMDILAESLTQGCRASSPGAEGWSMAIPGPLMGPRSDRDSRRVLLGSTTGALMMTAPTWGWRRIFYGVVCGDRTRVLRINYEKSQLILRGCPTLRGISLTHPFVRFNPFPRFFGQVFEKRGLLRPVATWASRDTPGFASRCPR